MTTNKRFLLSILLVCTIINAHAQIAKWLVHPKYSHIEMMDCGLLKVSLDGKTGLVDKTGKEILPAQYDSIAPFRENKALLFVNNEFNAITDMQGDTVNVAHKHYKVFANAPYFASGYLLVQDQKHHFYYINSKGQEIYGPYAEAYPFSEDIACVRSFANLQKDPDDTYYKYIHVKDDKFSLPNIEKEDISFLSSFHNGNAIAVIKKKFFTFEADTRQLRPLSVDSTRNKKSLVIASDKVIIPYRKENNWILNAKNGKFIFDSFMRLQQMELLGNEAKVFTHKTEKKTDIKSAFTIITKDNLYGLNFNGETLLPPQFDKILLMKDDFAIVKLNGKCGVITVDTENSFKFKLNNNEHIGFTHQYYVAKLAVMLPSYIKCSSATISSKSDDCEIQIETRTENENVEGNTLGYDCRLSIPKDLSDILKEHEYRYSLKYDGLVSIDHIVSISEWYVKYYEVNLSNTNFSISPKDSITVEFDLIKTDVARNDEVNYFKDVELVSANFPNEMLSLNKITENHFSFRLFGIEQERIAFSVKITEVGCPPIEYPFEMVFLKPKPREKNQKTTVTIKAVRKQERKESTIFIPE